VKRLIVNADDFGLTSGVNRAILQLHRQGQLTSATLMARARATEEAIQLARATPTLGVGCHIVLVDGEPALPATQLPQLTNPATGRFHPTLGRFLRTALTSSQIRQEVEAEATAQIALLQNRGLHLTHIDTHKHTHMFPQILRPVLRAARKAGIRAIRNPFEPAWSVRATLKAAWLRRTQVQILRTLRSKFLRIVAEEGLATTQGAVGVLATGTLDRVTLDSLLTALPNGLWELVTHPGYNDPDLAQANTRLLASRETEIQALAALSSAKDCQLIHYGQIRSKHP